MRCAYIVSDPAPQTTTRPVSQGPPRVIEHKPDVVRRNFRLNVVDGAVFAFGLGFASRSTVLPVFVKNIGGDSIAISLIPVLWILGFNMPQLTIANYAGQVSPKKPLLLKTGLAQRLPWLLLAVVTYFWIDALAPAVALPLFLVLFTLAAAGGSLNLPVWFDIVSKLTPVRMRGRLFAFRTVLGGVLGIFAGWIVERVLATWEYPESFALLFGLAFAAMMISYVFLCLLHEGDQVLPKKTLRYGEYLRSLPRILREETNFRNFLIGESLLIAATMVEAFFVVDAIESFGLPDSYAGRFTAVIMLSMVVGTLLFGYLADRWGHRINMVLSAAWMIVACFGALMADSVLVYYVVFVASALTLGLRTVSRLPIVAELCGEEDRPTYVMLTNVVTAPFVLAGVAAGWAANVHGYDTVFFAAGVLAVAACLWMIAMLDEPRKET